MEIASNGQTIIIDKKEYTLQGIPEHIWLNGAPSAFQDPKVMLPIVEYIDEPREGGFNCYYVGQKYPRKGVLTPDALVAATITKRLILTTSRLLPKMWFIAPFFLIPYVGKKLQWHFLNWYSENSHHTMERFYLNPVKACVSVRELWRSAIEIFKDDRLTEDQRIMMDRMVVSIGLCLEYDDSYRYRFQDIFGELNKEEFCKNPTREIKRLYELMWERDGYLMDGVRVGAGTRDRFGALMKILPIVFKLFPHITNKMREFVKEVDLSKVRLDEGDFYHCLMRYDFSFRGVPISTRMALRKKIDEEYKTNGNIRTAN